MGARVTAPTLNVEWIVHVLRPVRAALALARKPARVCCLLIVCCSSVGDSFSMCNQILK